MGQGVLGTPEGHMCALRPSVPSPSRDIPGGGPGFLHSLEAVGPPSLCPQLGAQLAPESMEAMVV